MEAFLDAMNADDILEIEQLKYYYEQAYTTRRHLDLPYLFCSGDGTVLEIAGDTTTGHGAIAEKFKVFSGVSSREDSYHTGWQICVPLIDIDEADTARVIAPTFGYLVLNLAPEVFFPPYTVQASFDLWDDTLKRHGGLWRLAALHARFLLAQPIWRWDAGADDSVATRCEMGDLAHPFAIGRYRAGREALC